MRVPPVFWFTGLPCAGKTTLTTRIVKLLIQDGLHAHVLDGDEMRSGLCANLGYGLEDRTENIRRIAECAKILTNAGVLCLTACITPLRSQRELARNILKDNFYEIFLRCNISKCEERDVKGLYRKSRDGKIPDLTGYNSPYETPQNPYYVVNTDIDSIEDCTNVLYDVIKGVLYR